jgi:hypothetical protein
VVVAEKAVDIARGGRGTGRFQGRRNWNSISSSTKQPEIKFFPHGIGRERQAVSYDTVKDHILQYVQKTYRNGIHKKS